MQCRCGKTVEPAYEATGRCEDCFANGCDNLANSYAEGPKSELMTEEEILNLSISELRLSAKTESRLCDKSIFLIKDLVKKTAAEIKSIPNFGDMAVVEIKRQLQKVGLALKEDKPKPSASHP